MIKKPINQNDIINSELINSYSIDYVFSNKSLNRIKTKPKVEDKSTKLDELRNEIEKIENCELKKNSNQIITYDQALAKINNNFFYKFLRFITTSVLRLKRLRLKKESEYKIKEA